MACVFVTGVKSSCSVCIQLFNHARIEHLHIYYSRLYVQRAKALQLVDHSLWYATLKDKAFYPQKGSTTIKKYMRKKFWTVIVYSGEVLYTVKFPLQCKNFALRKF